MTKYIYKSELKQDQVYLSQGVSLQIPDARDAFIMGVLVGQQFNQSAKLILSTSLEHKSEFPKPIETSISSTIEIEDGVDEEFEVFIDV